MSDASHDEVVFPLKIAYGATGGPGFDTEINKTKSNREQRNQNWSREARQWDVAQAVQTQADLNALRKFFRLRRGKARSFLMWDPIDNASCDLPGTPTSTDQLIGTGDGALTQFQLKITYSDGFAPDYVYYVIKPKLGTVLISVDGVQKTETTDYTVDYTTGIVTLLVAPTAGKLVKWGGRYYIVARFDTDDMKQSLADYNAFTWGQIPVVELKKPILGGS